MTTSVGTKFLLPKDWYLANDKIIPPGMKLTSSGKVIPKDWIFDEESKRILPNNYEGKLVGLKGVTQSPFAEDVQCRI